MAALLSMLSMLSMLATLVVLAPASQAAERGVPQGRTTTVRAACVGGGRMLMTADQPGDGSIAISATASNLPLDSVWDGAIQVDSAGGGGGGGGFGDTQPNPDGSITSDVTVGGVPDPIVRVNFHTQDGLMVCIVRVQPERQWVRTTCRLSGRLLSATAEHHLSYLDVTARLDPVPPKSAWNSSASITSPHASEGTGAATHASAAGVVRLDSRFDYVANRVLAVAFTNSGGNGCRLTIGAHRLPVG
jgi:hypothetical protein